MINNNDNDKQSIPDWLINGNLIPKSENIELATNYLPITCLNNVYELLRKIISERSQHYLTKNYWFPVEQKGCIKNTYGRKTTF